MGKVVINVQYGGFSLSEAAQARFEELAGFEFCHIDTPRHEPILVQVVEEMGDAASGPYTTLLVKEFEGNKYRILEQDGWEDLETPKSIIWTSTDDYPSKPSMRKLADTLKNDRGFDVQMNEEIGHDRPGMTVKCANGNTVSVQWGDMNYCSNKNIRALSVKEDCDNAEVAIWGQYKGEEDVWHGVQEHDDVVGWQSPKQVEEWVLWAAQNNVMPRPKLPWWDDLKKLVKAVKAEIDDDYRASEDDDEPGIQLTVGWDGVTDWSFQTGDNSYTGGAYGYPHWAVVSVYRDADSGSIASEIQEQLEEASAAAQGGEA